MLRFPDIILSTVWNRDSAKEEKKPEALARARLGLNGQLVGGLSWLHACIVKFSSLAEWSTKARQSDHHLADTNFLTLHPQEIFHGLQDLSIKYQKGYLPVGE